MRRRVRRLWQDQGEGTPSATGQFSVRLSLADTVQYKSDFNRQQ